MTGIEFAELLMTDRNIAADYLKDLGFEELALRIQTFQEAPVYWASFAKRGTEFVDYVSLTDWNEWLRNGAAPEQMPEELRTDPWCQMSRVVESFTASDREGNE